MTESARGARTSTDDASRSADRGTPPTSERATKTLTLVVVCVGYFMVILDSTIVNVSLPAIRAGLGSGVAGLQWVVNAYTLVFASLLLAAGGLGDRVGAKRIFLAGLAVFTVASAACGLAPSLGALVAARVVQGLGAALLVPASLSLLTNYLKRDKRC